MTIRVEGIGVSLYIKVEDAFDLEIVRLAILMADRHKKANQLRLFKD